MKTSADFYFNLNLQDSIKIAVLT